MFASIIPATLMVSAFLFTGTPAGEAADLNPDQNIVEIAAEAGSFNTLVEAVKAADLVETLAGDGPFTVFAPTDEAFAQIPTETLQALLADKEALSSVLTYHVVPGKVMAEEVVNLTSARTANGQEIQIKSWGGKVMVNDATIITTDIEATNGVIHVIDKVILPEMN